MSPVQLEGCIAAALSALARWLQDAGVPYAIIGGVAVTIQATPRFTHDIDAVIWARERDWSTLVSEAAAFGFVPRRPDVLDFARRSRVLLLEHDTGVPVDLSCGALTFEELVTTEVDVGAVTVRVARPEHLLVFKAIAGRPQDEADIHALIPRCSAAELEKARQTLGEFATALDDPEMTRRFEQAVERVRRPSGATDD